MNTLSELSQDFFTLLHKNNICNYIKSDEIRCLRKSIEDFLKTGLKEDAFIVYFCYCEIFHLFGEGYENTQKLLELLSDHEYHTGELLAKYRDHYSHSAYVFALGLAIYAKDKIYRDAFCKFYDYKEDDGAVEFLRYWGMASLFHDIGYPFQLAHEQIKAYCEELWGNSSSNLYVSYGNLKEFISINKNDQERIFKQFDVPSGINTINDILAYSVHVRQGYETQIVAEKLYSRVLVQPNFMDHGYFSSLLLLKQLIPISSFNWNIQVLDTLSAILLHNSFNKYEAPDRHPISLEEHPLAYLLILCDELQNWDRLAYGKISKKDPIAWDVKLDISDGSIVIKYLFNEITITDVNNTTRINKSFDEIQSGVFVTKILGGTILGKSYDGFISSNLRILAMAEEKAKEKKTSSYASDNNLINLYDFAVAIHASYSNLCKESKDALNIEFGKLPLEFKISNIQLAKSYAQKLELINCFYSSRDLDYPILESFEECKSENENQTDLEVLSREEHVRWVKEKANMGWRYGDANIDFKSIEERNEKKLHNCLVPYELLPENDKSKDILMIRNIIPMLRKIGNNIRVYRYQQGRKPTLVVAGVGHRYLNGNIIEIKRHVKQILKKLSVRYQVIVRTSYAYGADQIIAESANELGITTHAILPMPYDKFLEYVREDAVRNGIAYTDDDEMKLRLLLAQTRVCKDIHNTNNDVFEVTAKSLIGDCDKLIAIWDGIEIPLYNSHGNLINRGGTYDCILKAKERGLVEYRDIYMIKCSKSK